MGEFGVNFQMEHELYIIKLIFFPQQMMTSKNEKKKIQTEWTIFLVTIN